MIQQIDIHMLVYMEGSLCFCTFVCIEQQYHCIQASEQGTMEGDHFYFVLEGPKYTYTELLEKVCSTIMHIHRK